MAGLLLSACQSTTEVDLLIRNATIIDIETGSQLENRFVFIQGDSILEVGDESQMDQFRPKTDIDAQGK